MSILHIQLLGEFRLVYGDKVVTTVNTPRLQSLLTHLILHRDAPQSRRHLAFLLWPDSSEAQARTNLRHQLHLLRQALPGADHFIQTDEQTIQWRSDTQSGLDVADFESASRRSSAMALQEAIELYQGDLLPSCYDEWILPLRERLRHRFIETLERLIGWLENEHDYTTAIRYAQRLRQFDPLHEATYRHLMRLYALSGDQVGVERIYQECVTLLQRELATPPTLATQQDYTRLLAVNTVMQRQNLPLQLTSFIGREAELTQLARLLADPACRLLTIVGMGGVGKTRLALQTAQGQIGAYLHGVYFIPLTSTTSPDFLVSTIADSLGFSFHGSQDPKLQLLNYLHEKEMLLLLDNFEHLLVGAGLVAEILTHAPTLKLLVTTRERLKLHGEWLFEVKGLTVPETPNEADLEEYSAAQLFLQSARRVQPGFTLGAEDKPAVGRLCQLVEGMPLGLELAAAWVRMLSCQEIAQELAQNLDLLTTSVQNAPTRHRNIHAVFDHSWQLLSTEEQRVFCQLSVFQGGFRRVAAAQVAGASLAVLAALVDKSLLHWNRVGRYEIHDLLRQYAAEKLAAIDMDKQAAQDRHSRYYLEFVHQQEKWLKSSQAQQALAEIRVEVDNVRLAWQRAVEHGWAKELGQVAQSLWLFYDAQGLYHEAEASFSQAVQTLQRSPAADERERGIGLGQVLGLQGWFLLHLGLIRKAKGLFQQSVALLRRFTARAELADTLQIFSMAAWVGGDYEEAQAILQEGLMIFNEQGSPWDIALCLVCLGNVMILLGNYGEAKHLLQQGLALAKTAGEPKLTALALNYLGALAFSLGNYTEAKQWSQESLTLSRAISDRWTMIMSLNHLGVATYLGGTEDWPMAKQIHEESLTIARELGNRREMAISHNYLGYVTCALAEYSTAKQHFLAALQTAIEGQVTPVALNALVGLATLLSQQTAAAADSCSVKQRERAVELLTLVLSHPASGHDVKDKAQRLWFKLEAELPPQVIAAAQAREQARTLEAVAAEVLMQKR